MIYKKFVVLGLIALSVNMYGADSIAKNNTQKDIVTAQKTISEFADNGGANLWDGVPNLNDNKNWKLYSKTFKSIRENKAENYPKRCLPLFKDLQKYYANYEKEGLETLIRELNLDGQGPRVPVIKNGKIDMKETIAKEVYTGPTNLILSSRIGVLRKKANKLDACSNAPRSKM